MYRLACNARIPQNPDFLGEIPNVCPCNMLEVYLPTAFHLPSRVQSGRCIMDNTS